MKEWNSAKIRKTFLEYFESLGYHKESSASLVPAGDQTLLFVNAGMVPFKSYFLGEKPLHQKACSSQKCVRAGGKHNDLKEVGVTARHHTFFEMMGNFIFQGADKKVAIQEAWSLITEHYKIPKDRLWVTVYHEDDEARNIWHEVIGLDQSRIIDCGKEDNFWSMGDTGPCGPCTEIFYDYGESVEGGLPGSEDSDGDRYVEIWNLVFMQYEMMPGGTQKLLPSMGLDTGMGLERLSSVLQDVQNNYDTDLFMPIIEKIQAMVKGIDITSARVIADHIRSSSFLIADQIYPSNEGRGYVLRRIIRRAIGFAYRSGMKKPFLYQLVPTLVENMKTAYPELLKNQGIIEKILKEEEEKFLKTIKAGMQRLEVFLEEGKDIDGKVAFEMYDTYGFPIDLLLDMAKKHNLQVDEKGYEKYMEKQRSRSREHNKFSQDTSNIDTDTETAFKGYETDSIESKITDIFSEDESVDHTTGNAIIVTSESPFYPEGGGEIGDIGIIEGKEGSFVVEDTQRLKGAILHIGYVKSGQLSLGDKVSLQVDKNRPLIAANHSATHLLHAALREVLGTHVIQKGSLVDANKLRFDFAHNKPLTLDEIAKIESRVNEEILKNHKRERISMPLKEAKKANIMALFDEKYEDPVNVITFGEFSKELCGGIHVNQSSEIGLFKLLSETGIASGIRRVEAVTGMKAYEHVISLQTELNQVANTLKCDVSMSLARTQKLLSDYKHSQKQCEKMEKSYYASLAKEWLDKAKAVGEYKIVFQSFDKLSVKTLRLIMEILRSSSKEALFVLQSKDEKITLLIGENGGKHQANTILNKVIEKQGGQGGGKANLAQGIINKAVSEKELQDLL